MTQIAPADRSAQPPGRIAELAATRRPATTRRPAATRRLHSGLAFCAALMLLAGCEQQLSTEYGKSRGRSGSQSINGFATLRRGFEHNGWRTRDVRQLGEHLSRLDALVWTPGAGEYPDAEVIHWMQGWLDERPRTLVYVLADQGSELQYWTDALELAPLEQRLEYRRRYARALTQWMTQGRSQDTVTQPWFIVQRVASGAGVPPKLRPLDALPDGRRLQSQRLRSGEAGPTELLRVVWEVPPSAQSHHPTAAGASSTASSSSTANSGSSAVGQSQVIVVAGGSQVSNLAMTTAAGQATARTLIAASESAGSGVEKAVGFLDASEFGVLVGDPASAQSGHTGMERLMVWPLSLVTLHLAVMGLVVGLILLPIFGRPRELPRRTRSDFAEHLQAVAALMHRTGGEAFARGRISDYFRRVRGENSGPWVLPEEPAVLPVETARAAEPAVGMPGQRAEPQSTPETINPSSVPPSPRTDEPTT